MNPIIEELNKEAETKDIGEFEVGDTVDVHVLIKEGEKERIQIFNGVCIAKRGRGINASFTVRRLVQGMGVERIFPFHSTRIVKVEAKRRGRVHRAKLYYLRDRIGKATRLKEDTRENHALKAEKK